MSSSSFPRASALGYTLTLTLLALALSLSHLLVINTFFSGHDRLAAFAKWHLGLLLLSLAVGWIFHVVAWRHYHWAGMTYLLLTLFKVAGALLIFWPHVPQNADERLMVILHFMIPFLIYLFWEASWLVRYLNKSSEL